MNEMETAVALCAVGAEKVVSNELRKLGFKVEESLYGRVRFKTNLRGLYEALIGLRAADRVLLEAVQFKAVDFDMLFEGTAAAAWERLVPKGMGLKVAKVRSNRSQLKAETTIQAMVHKAAAQRLCSKYKISRLPEAVNVSCQPSLHRQVSNTNGQSSKLLAGGRTGQGDIKIAEVRVYIEKDIVSLLVDLSGEPLFKRGYRSEGGAAPLRETTAASILLLSGWKRKYPLYDPFCGSATILLEAAMYAWDMAPGLGRKFAIEDLAIADNKIEQTVREEFRSKIDLSRIVRIAGSDEDMRSVSIAASNAVRLRDIAEGRTPQRGIRLEGEKQTAIDLKIMPMREARPLVLEAGFLITNPPYGKRLGDQAAAELTYREMEGLRQRFEGWKLALITDHSGFESFFGKKADSCREISNGAIPSYFFLYELL